MKYGWAPDSLVCTGKPEGSTILAWSSYRQKCPNTWVGKFQLKVGVTWVAIVRGIKSVDRTKLSLPLPHWRRKTSYRSIFMFLLTLHFQIPWLKKIRSCCSEQTLNNFSEKSLRLHLLIEYFPPLILWSAVHRLEFLGANLKCKSLFKNCKYPSNSFSLVLVLGETGE